MVTHDNRILDVADRIINLVDGRAGIRRDTIGSNIDHELMHFLLTENRRMRFGAFHLDDANQVLFAESVLGGENMDLMELQTCILSVVTIADTYDDVIAQRFGGQRAIDRLQAMPSSH
jgi:hypothetical protein